MTLKVSELPSSPGVYLMKDAGGRVLYVGKASNLKKRVSSYLRPRARDRYQIGALMKRVADLETFITENEKAALLLENTLIKKYRPKFNIQLRDDKSYLSLKLSLKDRFPRLYVTRQVAKDGSLYFGPYPSGLACHETVDFIEKHFRLRTCSNHEFAHRSRPCLQYQIHRCDAPCVAYINEPDYARIVDQVRLFLQGHNHDLLETVQKEMAAASEREEFEKATQFRDLIQAIKKTLERQTVARHAWIDQDVLGVYREGERLTLCLVEVREGKVWASRLYHTVSYEEEGAVVEEFLNRYYEGRPIPDEILLPVRIRTSEFLQEVLAERRGEKVLLVVPQRGERRDLIHLACRNAEEGFKHRERREEEFNEILSRLQSLLQLQNLPRRIECFDISNLGGKKAVGSLVCFVEGEPFKQGYRRFRIKGAEQPDDYRMMKEVLSRRLLHTLDSQETGEGGKWVRPDLIVVDGGRGQLQVALSAMSELGVTGIDLVALAKARDGEASDKIYRPGRKNPVIFKSRSSLLHLLMRIRDEAHRFAITYHRKLRSKAFLP